MDYFAMVGKLVAWNLVGQKKRIGLLVGIFSSLLMAVPAYQAGIHGLTLYSVLVAIVQTKSFIRWNHGIDT